MQVGLMKISGRNF